jgi:dTDP-4-amino-4,6-dideoxygalactose transaminase
MIHPIINKRVYKIVEAILGRGRLSDYRGSQGEWYLGGEHVKKLESVFQDYFGVKYAVAMNSATSALHVACVACGISNGEEVIVSPYTFSSSASCVLMANGIPVFADIEDETFCIDPIEIEKKITYQTKAIIPVHLFGHPANMDAIMKIARKYKLRVIEDSAQAIGAQYHGKYTGTIGDCGIFSFNQSKHISSGEGGMLITNDDYIAEVARAMRNHAEVSNPNLRIVGYNYRMCEIEAAIVLDQFKDLDHNLVWRRHLAEYMDKKLYGTGLFVPKVEPNCTHSYYVYALRYYGKDRNAYQKRLADNGVYFGVKGYAKPLYLLPIYGEKKGLCPITEDMYDNVVMGMDRLRYPMTIKDIDKMVEVMKTQYA